LRPHRAKVNSAYRAIINLTGGGYVAPSKI
jgi:hypothetical protein